MLFSENRFPLFRIMLAKAKRPRIAPRPFRRFFVRLSPNEIAYFVMSTSLVSGRKKKPMTAVIDAKMIGYQRPA